MLVKCIETQIASLKDPAMRDHVSRYNTLGEIDLMIGEHYQVFGVSFWDGIPWYLLCEEVTDEYPTPYCSLFFELVDRAVSPGWSLSLKNLNVGGVALLPNEWAANSSFLERLVDGDIAAISQFEDIKAREENQTRRAK